MQIRWKIGDDAIEWCRNYKDIHQRTHWYKRSSSEIKSELLVLKQRIQNNQRFDIQKMRAIWTSSFINTIFTFYNACSNCYESFNINRETLIIYNACQSPIMKLKRHFTEVCQSKFVRQSMISTHIVTFSQKFMKLKPLDAMECNVTRHFNSAAFLV